MVIRHVSSIATDMNKQEKKRLALFKKYSENFGLVRDALKEDLKLQKNGQFFPIPDNAYLCPICLEPFVESDIYEKDSNFLTLEDVPPKSLGGKPTLLTCKLCNNESGRSLDSHLKLGMETEQVFKGKTKFPIKARFQFGESNIGGTLNFEAEKSYEMKIANKSNPNAKEDIDNFFKNWGKESMNISFVGPNENKVRIGLLRIAYLKMLEYFGCGIYLNPNVQEIRRQISKPEESIIDKIGVFSFPIFEDKVGIHILTEPAEYSVYLVVFKTALTGYEKVNCVPFPGPTRNAMQSYENLKNLKGKFNPKFKQLVKEIDWLDNKRLFGYDFFWNYYCKHAL